MRTPLYTMVLGLFLLSACEQPTGPRTPGDPELSVNAAGGVVQSISGAWTIEGTRTFTFNAERRLDGTVTGQWQRVNQSIERREGGTITCFAIQGNEVWVGTRTTHGPSSGTDGWFRAVDNGEGPDAGDGISGHAVGRRDGAASQYCNTRPDAPSYREVGAGEVQVRGRTPPDFPGPDPILLATIEWPFSPLDRTFVPTVARIDMYYNGFYNAPPCTNAETSLAPITLDWGTTGFVHRYDAVTDAGFAGFASCLTSGGDETLSFGVEGVSGWAVEESIALDAGAPDLHGYSLAYAELVVDEVSTAPSPAGVEVTLVMRWHFYGN